MVRSGQHIEEEDLRREGGKERLDAETNTINSGFAKNVFCPILFGIHQRRTLATQVFAKNVGISDHHHLLRYECI